MTIVEFTLDGRELVTPHPVAVEYGHDGVFAASKILLHDETEDGVVELGFPVDTSVRSVFASRGDIHRWGNLVLLTSTTGTQYRIRRLRLMDCAWLAPDAGLLPVAELERRVSESGLV